MRMPALFELHASFDDERAVHCAWPVKRQLPCADARWLAEHVSIAILRVTKWVSLIRTQRVPGSSHGLFGGRRSVMGTARKRIRDRKLQSVEATPSWDGDRSALGQGFGLVRSILHGRHG